MTDEEIHSIWQDYMGVREPPMSFARAIIAQARAELIAEMNRKVIGYARMTAYGYLFEQQQTRPQFQAVAIIPKD